MTAHVCFGKQAAPGIRFDQFIPPLARRTIAAGTRSFDHHTLIGSEVDIEGLSSQLSFDTVVVHDVELSACARSAAEYAPWLVPDPFMKPVKLAV